MKYLNYILLLALPLIFLSSFKAPDKKMPSIDLKTLDEGRFSLLSHLASGFDKVHITSLAWSPDSQNLALTLQASGSAGNLSQVRILHVTDGTSSVYAEAFEAVDPPPSATDLAAMRIFIGVSYQPPGAFSPDSLENSSGTGL